MFYIDYNSGDKKLPIPGMVNCPECSKVKRSGYLAPYTASPGQYCQTCGYHTDNKKTQIAPYAYDKEDVDRSNSIQYLADVFGVSANSLSRMQNGKWADILYPRSLLAAYHLTLSMTHLISEDRCDQLIQEFMSKQDPIKYAELYQSAVSTGIRKLVAARVLCASFGKYDGSRMNNLPKSMKYNVCDHLKVSSNITFNEACSLIEKLNKEVDHETLILARIGYLMMWKNWSGVAGMSGYFTKLLK